MHNILYIFICNNIFTIVFREALVYFTLSCIAGILVFGSCVLGEYLSRTLSATPRRHRYQPFVVFNKTINQHWTTFVCRSHSIRSRQSLCKGDMTMLHGPGPPVKLGSWNNQRWLLTIWFSFSLYPHSLDQVSSNTAQCTVRFEAALTWYHCCPWPDTRAWWDPAACH